MSPCHIEITTRLYSSASSTLIPSYSLSARAARFCTSLSLFLSVSLHIAFFILCAATHSPFVSPSRFSSLLLFYLFHFFFSIFKGKRKGKGKRRVWVRSCEWKRNRKKDGKKAGSSLCPEAAAARAETDTEAAIALGTRQLACIGLWETSRREARGKGSQGSREFLCYLNVYVDFC